VCCVYALAMDGILTTLNHLSLAQMVLAWLFVACYALALGGMLGARGSLRAAVVALGAAMLFSALSDDWVHGALLVLFAVAGMGLFVASSWALAHGIAWALRQREQPLPEVASEASTPAVAPRPMNALRALWRTHLAP
jgi:hypothetical protein